MLSLKPDNLASIKTIAERAYPYECCGLLVGAVDIKLKQVNQIVEADNQRSDSASNRYLIAPEFLLSWEKRLRGGDSQILGFFHSHPNVAACPSDYDREHAWPWYSYMIVSVQNGRASEVLSWLLQENGQAFEPEEWRLELEDL